MATGTVLVILVIVGFIYFIPSFVAYSRKKKNKSAILVLNIFLGWTLLGWVIAAVWASMED